MPTVSVRIPQIGEGLQEARLVAVLKSPGDHVRRDEPIYQMETDKAVMDVESPFEGILTEWLAQPDEILAIGAEVARMEVSEGVEEPAAHAAPGSPSSEATAMPNPSEKGATRNAAIPPRTRAYAKEKGLADEVLASIPSASGKLMPADIDAYLESGPAGANAAYTEAPLPAKQRLLASRLVRGSQLVVPGTMTVVAKWGSVEAKRAQIKAGGGEFQPSAFTMFAFAVAQTLADFPAFRSSLVGEDTLRTYKHGALGVAVALPGDELVLAVVDDVDALDWPTFAAQLRERIDLARGGKDQANESVTLSLTNMQAFGLRDAVPVVVPPAVATLFLGEPHYALDEDAKPVRVVNLALTFDHRLVNGVGAAEFLNAVKRRVETISQLV